MELKVVPITPLSDIVTVLGGVPGAVCVRTLPVKNRESYNLTHPYLFS